MIIDLALTPWNDQLRLEYLQLVEQMMCAVFHHYPGRPGSAVLLVLRCALYDIRLGDTIDDTLRRSRVVRLLAIGLAHVTAIFPSVTEDGRCRFHNASVVRVKEAGALLVTTLHVRLVFIEIAAISFSMVNTNDSESKGSIGGIDPNLRPT